MSDEDKKPRESLYTGVVTALQVAGEGVQRDTIDSLQIVGDAMGPKLQPDEKCWYFTPAFIKIDGKSRPGALAFTETNLIVGYTEGATKLKTTYAKVIPLSLIRSSIGRSKIGTFAAKERTISIAAPGVSFDAVFNADGNKKGLFSAAFFLLRGVGTVTFDEEGETKDFSLDTNSGAFAQVMKEIDTL